MRISRTLSNLFILAAILGLFIAKADSEGNDKVMTTKQNLELYDAKTHETKIHVIREGEEIISIDSADEKYAYISDRLGKKDKDWILVSEIKAFALFEYEIVKVQVVQTKEIKNFNFVYIVPINDKYQ